MPWIPSTTIASSAGTSAKTYKNMRQITKNQNRFAWVVALLIGLFVVSMTISGIANAETLTDHINSVREKPLKDDKFLIRLAEDRCKTMSEWSHNGFYSYANEIMYTFSWKGIKTRNKYAAENLANGYNNDKDVFVALQASPSHKANNESKLYQKIGVARCSNKVGLVTVVLFSGN